VTAPAGCTDWESITTAVGVMFRLAGVAAALVVQPLQVPSSH
jgi:hypothetical protein